jgi:hypothetical protein
MFARIQRRTGRQIIISTHSSDLLQDEGIGLDEVVLLEPGEEGTSVRVAKDSSQIESLVASGLTVAEAAVPQTRPEKVEQLVLFGD